MPQQHGQLAGGEAHAGSRGGGPPLEAALGEPFGAQPKPLAVVDQECERGARAVAKTVDGAAQGILAERLATEGGEAIYPFAKIDGLQRDKAAALGGELEQQRLAKKVWSRGASAGLASW
jgi:hypothetical protein